MPRGTKGTLVLINSTRPIYSDKSLVECQIEFEVTCRTAVAIIGAHPSIRFWRSHTAPGTGDFNAIIVEQKQRHGLATFLAGSRLTMAGDFGAT